MIDYSAVLYDPVYAEIGVPATLNGVDITVIDDTRPKIQSGAGGVETRGVGPGAFARIPELDARGITRTDYEGAALTFNGRSWVVRSHDLIGSPNGEDMGQVRFLLKAVASTDG